MRLRLALARTRWLCLLLALGFGHTLHAKRPNIIILADDLGWAELGCYGNRFNETPHLDHLAKRSLVVHPRLRIRAGLLALPGGVPHRPVPGAGRHSRLPPAQLENGLSTDHVTLSERLRDAGYATGMIGRVAPLRLRHYGARWYAPPTTGSTGTLAAKSRAWATAPTWPYMFRSQPIRWLDLPEQKLGRHEYLTDRLNHEAVQFIERNRDKPFFLFLSTTRRTPSSTANRSWSPSTAKSMHPVKARASAVTSARTPRLLAIRKTTGPATTTRTSPCSRASTTASGRSQPSSRRLASMKIRSSYSVPTMEAKET